MRALLVLTAASMLCGCGTLRAPRIVYQKSTVQVNRSCIPEGKLSPAPAAYADDKASMLAARDAAERYQLSTIGSLEKSRRLAQLEPVVDGCRGAQPAGVK